MPKKVVTKKTDSKEVKETPKPRKRRDYIYAVGRRKKSICRVRLYKKGEGKIIINEQDLKKYFPLFELQEIINSPLKAVGKKNDFNFTIKVTGGGFRGQAEAIRLGISRALIKFEKNLRATLKPLGFLSRDARAKERKKPGLKRARRAPQWAKR